MPERRFNLLDAMALIATIAVCFRVPGSFESFLSHNLDGIGRIMYFPHPTLTVASIDLLLITATLIGLLVLCTHPKGRARYLQPGAIALLMVALTFAFCECQALLRVFIDYWKHDRFSDSTAIILQAVPFTEGCRICGLAILGAWFTLGLMSVWKPGRDWLDRSSYLIGWIWLLHGFFTEFLNPWY